MCQLSETALEWDLGANGLSLGSVVFTTPAEARAKTYLEQNKSYPITMHIFNQNLTNHMQACVPLHHIYLLHTWVPSGEGWRCGGGDARGVFDFRFL